MFAQSEWIVRYADAHLAPELRLFTGDPDEVALSRRLDAGLGPDGRRLIYSHMLPRPALMLPYNNQGVPPLGGSRDAGALSRRGPLGAPGAERRAADAGPVLAEFDSIAERLADGRRHLCGDRFTAADLTFACLAAAVVLPPEYGVALPQPEPVARSCACFASTPPAPTRSSSSASSGARRRGRRGSKPFLRVLRNKA